MSKRKPPKPVKHPKIDCAMSKKEIDKLIHKTPYEQERDDHMWK